MKPARATSVAVGLLAVLAGPARAADDTASRALMAAAGRGEAARLTAQLQAGADPNARDAAGRPALVLAVASGRPEAVKALLRGGADPSLGDRSGWTALHQAAEAGDVDGGAGAARRRGRRRPALPRPGHAAGRGRAGRAGSGRAAAAGPGRAGLGQVDRRHGVRAPLEGRRLLRDRRGRRPDALPAARQPRDRLRLRVRRRRRSAPAAARSARAAWARATCCGSRPRA